MNMDEDAVCIGAGMANSRIVDRIGQADDSVGDRSGARRWFVVLLRSTPAGGGDGAGDAHARSCRTGHPEAQGEERALVRSQVALVRGELPDDLTIDDVRSADHVLRAWYDSTVEPFGSD
jgi:hypothetical protein